MQGDNKRKIESRIPSVESLQKTAEQVIDNIGKRNGKPEFETGLEVIDVGLNGLHRTQLTILGARPGVGKTALAGQIAIHLAKQGIRVAFISLEMTKQTVLERIFCNEFKINSYDLNQESLPKYITDKFIPFIELMSKLPLQIIDDYAFTVDELYTLIEHLNFKFDVLILDHLQHISSQKGVGRWDTLTEYLRYVKEISLRFNFASLILSQINRDGTDRPTMANLKGTGAIEEMADHILLMHPIEHESHNLEIGIAKNRFGRMGKFDLYFQSEFCKFINYKR